ncbi:MAG: response regulator [Pseudomonadota bacterium]
MARHVLLVEDEANIVEAIRFILLRDGWSVSTHSNGATALDAIRSTAPDVLVLDVMLPNKSGFDILRELRADPGIAKTPVLMLTARGQKKDRELALSLGASQFMTKPFANSEVVAAIAQLADDQTA